MMILPTVVIALLLQGAPAAERQPVARATLAGLVVLNATGEPISGVGV